MNTDMFKCRAKRKDNGDWVFGNFLWIPDYDVIGHLVMSAHCGINETIEAEDVFPAIMTFTTKQHSNYAPSNPVQVISQELHIIDETTLGRYIGLKDKSGKLSWEGDKVKILSNRHPSFKSEYISNDNYGVIVWDDELACFAIKLRFILSGQFEGETRMPLHNTSFEIIGNIHEK